ncbi:MAG: pyruvate, phosphate dikinase, partial [Lentisphaeria bacterium]|nr:pyruvate, phosphate dikinase [Lentisphaeria bacterium]
MAEKKRAAKNTASKEAAKTTKATKKSAPEAKKYVYLFGKGMTEGAASMKNLLGGKGANLAEMANLKMPVPAGFTITTECCVDYFNNQMSYPAALAKQVDEALAKVEKLMGMKFGDPKNPLL